MSGIIKSRTIRIFIKAVALIGMGLPLFGLFFLLGGASNLTVPEAKSFLQNPSNTLIVVDDSLSPRIPEAKDWPFQSIMKTRIPEDMQENLRGKSILLMCPGGIQSALAAKHLRRIGVDNAFSIRGGYQEWITQSGEMHKRINPSEAKNIPAFRPSPLFEQFAAVLAFFGVKTIYSMLAAIIIACLWRKTASDLVAMRRSMTAFFIGEGFCFINVLFYGDHNLLFEHLHSVGMAISLAFFFYSLIEFLDSRLIHYSDEKRCIMTGICGTCFKRADAPCGLRRTLLLSSPLLALTAALPLFSPLRDSAYNTLVFGFVYGYRHPIIHQLYELRYLPCAAIALFALSFLALSLYERRPAPLSKALFSAALGATAFSFLRLILTAVFIDRQVWFAAWEEVSELIYVMLAGNALFFFPRIMSAMNPKSHNQEEGAKI
jgi:rhodanese-related sulfurtransferase